MTVMSMTANRINKLFIARGLSKKEVAKGYDKHLPSLYIYHGAPMSEQKECSDGQRLLYYYK